MVVGAPPPLGVLVLLRLRRQYAGEDAQLEADAAEACEAPVLRRHTVLVLVDRVDLATARAVQYARTLTPDRLRAVHFDIDPREAAVIEHDWSRLGLSRLPLDIIDCPDRRLARAALELAAEITSNGDTELTMLLPRRGFAAGWRRLLHDRSADRIAAAVGQLPHVNATIVPFQAVGRVAPPGPPPGPTAPGPAKSRSSPPVAPRRAVATDHLRAAGARGSGHHAHWRRPMASTRAGGRTDQVGERAHRGAPPPTWECTLVDDSRGQSCSCSRGGAASPVSSRGRGSWPRAWWARGKGGWPS